MSSPLLMLSLRVPVVQVFCVIPKYVQPFLRKTLGTREWPPPSPAAGGAPGQCPLTRPGVLPVLSESAGARGEVLGRDPGKRGPARGRCLSKSWALERGRGEDQGLLPRPLRPRPGQGTEMDGYRGGAVVPGLRWWQHAPWGLCPLLLRGVPCL